MGQGRGWKGGGAPTSRGKRTPGAVPGGGTPGGGGGGGGGGTSSPRNSSPGGVQNPGGGGKGGGGGGSNLPPMPKPFPDNFRRKPDTRRDTPKLLAEDIEAVNPRFLETNQDPNLARQWDINCTRCAATVEMRARGYDVTAMPKPENVEDNYTHMSAEKWRTPNGEVRGFTDVDALTRDTLRSELDGMLLEYPEGSRGLIRTTWATGGGHIFNWEIRGGKVHYIDGQSNESNAGVGWIKRVSLFSHNTQFLRVDDLTPHEDIMRWVRSRTDVEVNAPLYSEMSSEMDRRWEADDERRAAFRYAWQLIRTNQSPEMPAEYVGIPELEQAFEEGLAWARRPD